MQFNSPFFGSSYQNNGFNFPYTNFQTQPVQQPEVVGEGEVISRILPDGNVQLFFLPTNKLNPFFPVPNKLYWFIKSVANPIPSNPLYCQSQPTYALPFPNITTCSNSFEVANPCCPTCRSNANFPSFQFHNDDSTSTTDLQYFFPPKTNCVTILKSCIGTQVISQTRNNCCQSEEVTCAVCKCIPQYCKCTTKSAGSRGEETKTQEVVYKCKCKCKCKVKANRTTDSQTVTFADEYRSRSPVRASRKESSKKEKANKKDKKSTKRTEREHSKNQKRRNKVDKKSKSTVSSAPSGCIPNCECFTSLCSLVSSIKDLDESITSDARYYEGRRTNRDLGSDSLSQTTEYMSCSCMSVSTDELSKEEREHPKSNEGKKKHEKSKEKKKRHKKTKGKKRKNNDESDLSSQHSSHMSVSTSPSAESKEKARKETKSRKKKKHKANENDNSDESVKSPNIQSESRNEESKEGTKVHCCICKRHKRGRELKAEGNGYSHSDAPSCVCDETQKAKNKTGCQCYPQHRQPTKNPFEACVKEKVAQFEMGGALSSGFMYPSLNEATIGDVTNRSELYTVDQTRGETYADKFQIDAIKIACSNHTLSECAASDKFCGCCSLTPSEREYAAYGFKGATESDNNSLKNNMPKLQEYQPPLQSSKLSINTHKRVRKY